jgi:tetratricopeptide (TPR) repeat protein
VSVIAVMPFAVTGDDRFSYLQEGIVNLLSTSLDGVAGLRSVNAHALLASAAGSVPDPARARQLAGRFGAGRFVMGDLFENNGTLRLSASLYPQDGTTPIVTVGEEGPDSLLFQLVDRLGARLVAEAALGGDPRARLATVTTASLPALRSYLDGERAYRAGQYLAAASAFQDAVTTDTAFALAFYRLSMAQERLAWADASQRSADQALRFASRLTDHQREFLAAVVALRHGETWRSEAMLRQLVAAHPDDAEAWYQLGEIAFHGNPLRGRSLIESREALRQALFYDPADLGAMYHLLRVLARRQDPTELDSLASVFFALTPSGDRTLELRALQAFTTSDADARSAVLAQVAQAPDNSLPLIVWSVATFAQDVPGALEVTALMRRPERPRDVQALGWLEEAHLEVARGRLAAARAALARAGELGSPDAAGASGWIAALPFLPAPGPRAPLAASGTATGSRPSVFFSVHDSVHDVVGAYLRGLDAVRRVDRTGVDGAVAELQAMVGHPSKGALAGELTRGLRAQYAAASGRPEEAL